MNFLQNSCCTKFKFTYNIQHTTYYRGNKDDKDLLEPLVFLVSKVQVDQEALRVDVDPLVLLECLVLKVKRVESVLMVLQVHQAHQVLLDLLAIEELPVYPAPLVLLEQEVPKVLRASEVILERLEKKVHPVLLVCQAPMDLPDPEVNEVKKDLLESLDLLVLVVVLEIRVLLEQLVRWDLPVDQVYP